jgi:hypothetical protein
MVLEETGRPPVASNKLFLIIHYTDRISIAPSVFLLPVSKFL